MKSVRIIPCMDVDGGRVKKGVRFLDLVDAGDPVDLAVRYDAEGADEVVFLDITASHEGRETMVEVVERAADRLFIPLTVGGGVRSVDDAKKLLYAGADKVSVNTAALERPELITEMARELGSQCVVVAIDVKRVSGAVRWSVYTHGGRRALRLDALAWAVEAVERGAGELLVTSMDRDGTGSGFDIALTRAVTDAVSVPVIASGGVGGVADFVEGALSGRAEGLLAAGVFHRREIAIADVKEALAAAGVGVRPASQAGVSLHDH